VGLNIKSLINLKIFGADFWNWGVFAPFALELWALPLLPFTLILLK